MARHEEAASTTCKLCLQPRELRKSHIIPEFLFKPGYDEKHTLLEIRADDPRHRRIQMGWRELLLCGDCEGFLNDNFERPISRMWWQLIPESVPESHDRLRLLNVPYATFKLFHLSILWRASVASGRAWSPVKLGPRHEERLRSMLRARDPGVPHDYPLFGNVMVGPKTRVVAAANTMAPTGGRIHGARVYVFIYGGCSWHFVVASHRVVRDTRYIPTPDDPMELCVYDLTEHRAFDMHMRANVRARVQARRRKARTDL